MIMSEHNGKKSRTQDTEKSSFSSDGLRKSTKKRTKKQRSERRRMIDAMVKIAVVILAVLAIVLIWRNRTDLSCVNMTQCVKDTAAMTGSGQGFPRTINGGDAVSLDQIGGGVALLSDTYFTVYNSSGKEAAARAHYMSRPAMKISGRYALLVDLGSTDYRLEATSGTIVTGDVEKPIISGAVSRSCRFAVVMQGSSKSSALLSSVEVRDRSGEILHKWHSADYYITDAALSPDGAYLAMCGVNASEGGLVSVIIIHKVGSSEEIAEYELAGNIYLSLEYTNTNTLFAFGSSGLSIVTDSGEKCVNVPLEGNLTAFDANYSSGAAICVMDEADENASVLSVYDARGNLRYSQPLELAGESLSLGSDCCSVLGAGRLATLNLTGTTLSTIEANAASGGLLLVGSEAYTADGIRIARYPVVD